MKKLILIVLSLELFTLTYAQKIIENPVFNGTTAPYVKITKITLVDTATILDFTVEYKSNWWIRVPKESWIQNSEGGEKLFVKSAKGIKIGEQHTTPANGINEYTLFFPPVSNDVEKIDFMEVSWKIFDIELVPQEHFYIFPKSLSGNWLRTDGSNEWVYGFYEDGVIYDSKFWKQVLVNQKDDVYQVLLQKEGNRKSLIIKEDGGYLLIGASEDNMERFSREKTFNNEYVIKNDKGFQLPIFKNDSTWYKGYFKGYNTKMGATGMVYVFDIFTQKQESYLITINSDGTFSVGFPMLYPQQVFVKILGMSESVYFEPGKATFQCYDLSSASDNEEKFLYMGETANINNNLLAMKSIRYFNNQGMRDSILNMSPEEYKVYCKDVENKEMRALKEFSQNNAVCKKAIQIKEKQISFNSWQNMLSYNRNRISVYRQINKVPRDQREIPLERVELSKDFFSFIDAEKLNNPLAVVAGGDYFSLINRVKFSDPVRPRGPIGGNIMGEVFGEFEARKIELPPQMRNMLLRFSDCKTNEERAAVMKKDSVLYHQFMEEFGDDYKEISMDIYTKKREEIQQTAFKEYFGLESGFAMEVMKSQDIAHRMESSFSPLTENQKEDLNTMDNKFLVSYLLDESKKLEEEIARKEEAFKTKSGFVVNETPDAKGGDLFDTIMEKYKGKLVFVDFWATWCGPCRSGMKRIKPLKEELKDKDIAFVYITNPTSPEKTWERMVPDIDGEHYRVTQDEWNIIASRFKVSGIPHYVLVGKDGKVLKDKVYFASSNAELKKLFGEYLE